MSLSILLNLEIATSQSNNKQTENLIKYNPEYISKIESEIKQAKLKNMQ